MPVYPSSCPLLHCHDGINMLHIYGINMLHIYLVIHNMDVYPSRITLNVIYKSLVYFSYKIGFSHPNQFQKSKMDLDFEIILDVNIHFKAVKYFSMQSLGLYRQCKTDFYHTCT